jgi:hypothetical protein
MKKIFFLMLTFLIVSAASMNAQVTIGSLDDPHPGALLDLKSTTQGLLLPQVTLSTSTNFLTTEGKATARGMLVYNTGNTLEGPGLYVWTGSVWNPIATIGLCTAPDTPGTITFSPALTGNIVRNTRFTATVPIGATSYTWSVPEGFEIVGDATGRSISIKATVIGEYDASGITVSATNDCGSSEPRAGVGTINVTGCVAAPAVPTLTIPVTKIEVGDTFTLQCSDVGADYYTWTLPDGLTAESNTTTADSIIVTGAAEGTYYAETISVIASNGCGDSAPKVGTTNLILVESPCEQPPTNLLIYELNEYRAIGTRFTVSVGAVSKGVTTYEWSVPAGLSIVSGNNTYSISVECTAAGSYRGSDIKVKIGNSCGNTTTAASGTITVIGRGTKGTDLAGANGAYTTFKYPMGLGAWMTANSKEGNPTGKTYSGHNEGERGYYYNAAEAQTIACPTGWTLPTLKQLTDLRTYLSAITTVTEENEPWIRPDVLAGTVTNVSTGAGSYWDQRLWIRGAGSTEYLYTTPATNTWTTGTNANATRGYSVRCIKATCDEAPTVMSLSNLGKVIPKEVPVKIYVNARSIGSPSYNWTVPANATFESEVTQDTIYVTFNSIGSFSGNNLSVTVSNDCGSTSMHYSGNYTITDTGTPGPLLSTPAYEYTTYVFPENLGTWMLDWSREGNPDLKTYKQGMELAVDEEYAEGERGYYYSYTEHKSGCPTGWRIPSRIEFYNALNFIRFMPEDNEYRNKWLAKESMPGWRYSSGTWNSWNSAVAVWVDYGTESWGANYASRASYLQLRSAPCSVVCIKDEN